MITKIEINNYRSLLNAEIELSPFTLLIGANGSGKTNFLHALQSLQPGVRVTRHFNHSNIQTTIRITNEQGTSDKSTDGDNLESPLFSDFANLLIFKLIAGYVGELENLIPNPFVGPKGQGVVRVLDSLKTGDREDLFNTIEKKFCEYVPEIEKLSFIPSQGGKKLQVRERCIDKLVPVASLSDGTKLVLILLTILYQEHPPSLICLEDIDQGLHPRLLEKLIRLCFDLAGSGGRPQIIATTHNPYLVDLFKGREKAVVIVEKVDGNTTLTTLVDRMNNLDDGEDPLGELWFSGAIGGVPEIKDPEIKDTQISRW